MDKRQEIGLRIMQFLIDESSGPDQAREIMAVMMLGLSPSLSEACDLLREVYDEIDKDLQEEGLSMEEWMPRETTKVDKGSLH